MHTKQHYYFEEARANLWATIFISKCSFVSKEKKNKANLVYSFELYSNTVFSLCWRFFLLPFDSQKWWNGKRFRKSIPSKFITRTVCCIYQPLIYRLKCCPSAVLAIILIRRTPNRSIVFQTVCFSLRLSSFNLFSIYWRIGEWQHNWLCFALCRTRMHLCSGYNTSAYTLPSSMLRKSVRWHDQMPFNRIRIPSNRIDNDCLSRDDYQIAFLSTYARLPLSDPLLLNILASLCISYSQAHFDLRCIFCIGEEDSHLATYHSPRAIHTANNAHFVNGWTKHSNA